MDTASPVYPAIDATILDAAYSGLREAKPVEDGPLAALTLVQQRLSRPYALRNKTALRQTIFDLLVEVLQKELARLRASFRLAPPDPASDRESSLQQLSLDAKQQNSLLTASSYVYYRHVRTDLNFSVKEIAARLSLNPRSLNRFESECWNHLAGVFIHLETEARRLERQHRCRSALPSYGFLPLKAHRVFISQAMQFLQEADPPNLLIHGRHGCGKSILAVQVANRLIQEGSVHEAIWLDLKSRQTFQQHPTANTLVNLICEALALTPFAASQEPFATLQVHLRWLASEAQKLLIVIDNADFAEAALVEVIPRLNHCVSMVVTQNPFTEWQGYQMSCPVLDIEDSLRLLSEIDRMDGKYAVHREELYAQIWEAVGGNPGALRRALRLSDYVPADGILSSLVWKAYYLEQWQRLTEFDRKVWIILDLLTHEKVQDYTTLSHRLSAYFETVADSLAYESALIRLIKTWLVEIFLVEERHLYQTNAEARHIVRDHVRVASLIEEFVQRSHHMAQTDAGFFAIQFLLRHSTETMQSSLISLLRLALPYVSRQKMWHTWQHVLQNALPYARQLEDRLWIYLQLAIVERWQGYLEKALDEIKRLQNTARQTTLPSLLTEMLVEESTLCFYLNRLEQALDSAYEAQKVAHEGKDEMLFRRATLALAQALSQQLPAEALKQIASLPDKDVTALDLIARLQIRLGDTAAAVRTARQCEGLIDEEDRTVQARVLGIAGRALVANGDIGEGIQRFQAAVNLLQTETDILGLARMLNNCGVAYLKHGELEKAGGFLAQAMQIHLVTEDHYARAITQENLEYCRAMQVRQPRVLRDRPRFYEEHF